MVKSSMMFTEEEFKEAMENLKDAYFFIRDLKGNIIGVQDEPTMEALMEEIKFLRYKKEISK